MFGKVYSVIKLLALKARYGKRLRIKKIRQIIRFDTEISVGKDAFLSLDSINVNTNVHLVCDDGRMSIGSDVFFNRNCIVVCRKGIKIGNECKFGPNVCIYDHDHVFSSDGVLQDKFLCSEIIIEDDCWIGAGVIILRGTHIGKKTVIGAGSVIKGVIPPNSLVTSSRETRTIPLKLLSKTPGSLPIMPPKCS